MRRLENSTLIRTQYQKPRAGCLGCLGQTAVVLVLGSVLIVAITGIFYPWAFYLGGNFHIIPYWQGWGTLHAKSGNYVLWVQFGPTPSRSRIIARSNLTGRAFLCSPRGERFRMKLGGGMRPHLNLSTNGEQIHLYMFYRPLSYLSTGDHRPTLDLRGQWKNPYLSMDDTGSIFRAFLPDGSVYHGHDVNHPYNGEIVPVEFRPGSYREFEAACTAERH